MALFIMIVRKMVKNKWLELSLLLGLILSIALASGIPIYTEAMMGRMLVKDLQNMQKSTGVYPGTYWSSVSFDRGSKPEEKATKLQEVDRFLADKAGPYFGIPVQQYVRQRDTEIFAIVPENPKLVNASINRTADITAIEGLEDHIKLVDGKMPAKEPVDGVYEALVVENALTTMKMVLGNVFVIDDRNVNSTIKIKPVGVFRKKTDDDLFFYNSALAGFNNTFFINFDTFEKDFTGKAVLPTGSASWYFALDYSQMDVRTFANFVAAGDWIEAVLSHRFEKYGVKAPAQKTLGSYVDREQKLSTLLWSLNVPVMVILAFYLIMVSNLILERQKTEIAVLRSRGATRMQIVFAFLCEGLLLGGIALLVGPYIGLLLTKMLGASNGFLEFVQRASLRTRINADSIRYAAIAVTVSLIMTLIPAYLATRATIVGHKQQMSRAQPRSFWHKFFLDAALLAVAMYGLYTFQNRMKDLLSIGLDSGDLRIDPLLFLVPSLFLLGTGIVSLRVYPLIVRLVYWAGRRWFPAPVYFTLIQVGRSPGQYQFLMVFLIMTIATGVFSASAARTIDKNVGDKILYMNGADIIVKVRWDSDAPASAGTAPAVAAAATSQGSGNTLPVSKPVQYTEPPFQQFTGLPGVESVAKVFVKEKAQVTAGKEKGAVTLMGIDTDEFGRTAWLKPGLLEHDFFEYLNLIAPNPSAVLISRSLADQKHVKVGDTVSIGWSRVNEQPFVVYGIIDYFPGFNPKTDPKDKGNTTSKGQAQAPMLVVGHLKHIQSHLALEPYSVWMKLKPNASRQQLYDAIEERKIPAVQITDTRGQLVEARADPFQLAINGAMTLGFLISVLISFFGFLLYWTLSLAGRYLQFGVLRAMGISMLALIGMLAVEQLLTSGAAFLIGMLTGDVTSGLFVQFFQLAFSPASQVLPFKATYDPKDLLHLYLIVALMIAAGLLVLGWMLSRIRIHQAIKLGED